MVSINVDLVLAVCFEVSNGSGAHTVSLQMCFHVVLSRPMCVGFQYLCECVYLHV